MNVLIVHSSADLYGSDRSLLSVVAHRHPSTKVVVCVPEGGPLCALLREYGATVIVSPLGKLQSGQSDVRGLFRFAISTVRSVMALFFLHRRHSFDVVYSNSIVVFAGAVFAFASRLPHVWHVREIPPKSALRRIFGVLLPALSRQVIANSTQTQSAFGWSDRPDCNVIWNGVPDSVGTVCPNGAHDTNRKVILAVVGRMNAWKGQDLLLKAVRRLFDDDPSIDGRVEVWLIGSAYRGQEYFEEALRQLVTDLRLNSTVRFTGFVDHPEHLYPQIDVLVVPSLRPEPFGRVAVEGMAASCAIVAARHGGLCDIVEHEVTGLLVEPNSVSDLASALLRLIQDGETRLRMGVAGRERQRLLFSEAAYARSVNGVLSGVTLDLA